MSNQNNRLPTKGDLITEARNPRTKNLDSLSARELVQLINAEGAGVAAAVEKETDNIATALAIIESSLKNGGRLVYIGAGTSGRLGILDAVECVPTFNTRPGQVIGIIAGGPDAVVNPAEGAEDDEQAAIVDLKQINLSDRDVLVGIAASGTTPYVHSALRYARSLNATCIGLSCNADAPLAADCHVSILPVVGPEVLSGSTRMKAGTATKLVLNILSTGAMVLLGKTYSNFMVDMRATNLKLMDRSLRILQEVVSLSGDAAKDLLKRCDGELKTAITVSTLDISVEAARQILNEADGKLRDALAEERRQ